MLLYLVVGEYSNSTFLKREFWLILRLSFFFVFYSIDSVGDPPFPREVKHLVYHWSADAAAFSCGRV